MAPFTGSSIRRRGVQGGGRGGGRLGGVCFRPGRTFGSRSIEVHGLLPRPWGHPSLLKTLAMEWPEVRVKSVDLLLEEPAVQLADHLLTEIEAGDDLVEVGYREGAA